MADDSIRFLSIQDVSIKTRLARSTIYKMVSENLFPPPIKLGPRASAWIEAEVQAWAEEKVASSRPVSVKEKWKSSHDC